jgi:hypothetical protein
MQYYVAKHIINRFPCLLTATLIQTSCTTLLSAKIRSTPGSVESDPTVHLDGFDFPELIYCIVDLYRVTEHFLCGKWTGNDVIYL